MSVLFVLMKDGVYIIKTDGRKTKWVYHWAILVINNGTEYVLHNSEYNEKNLYGGSVKMETLKSFLTKYKPLKFYLTRLTEKEVLERSKPLLSKPYTKVLFNCYTYVKKVNPAFSEVAQEEKLYWFGLVGLSWYLLK